jgi:hypothetical protein
MGKGKCKSVIGNGINDYSGQVVFNGVSIKSYLAWINMLKRCYYEKLHKKRQTYSDCRVCDEWLLFSNFKKWFDDNCQEGYALDKDILQQGNKIYSPETCCFVPKEINNLLIKHDKKRGDLPIGIYYDYKKYQASVCIGNGKRKIAGRFDTVEEAFNAYKSAKEEIIRHIAEKYYTEGKIPKNVYKALIKYKVNIED